MFLGKAHLQAVTDETVHYFYIPRIMEILHYVYGYYAAYAVNLCKLLNRGCTQCLYGLEVTCENLCSLLTHHTYAEGKDHTLKRHLL